MTKQAELLHQPNMCKRQHLHSKVHPATRLLCAATRFRRWLGLTRAGRQRKKHQGTGRDMLAEDKGNAPDHISPLSLTVSRLVIFPMLRENSPESSMAKRKWPRAPWTTTSQVGLRHHRPQAAAHAPLSANPPPTFYGVARALQSTLDTQQGVAQASSLIKAFL